MVPDTGTSVRAHLCRRLYSLDCFRTRKLDSRECFGLGTFGDATRHPQPTHLPILVAFTERYDDVCHLGHDLLGSPIHQVEGSLVVRFRKVVGCRESGIG